MAARANGFASSKPASTAKLPILEMSAWTRFASVGLPAATIASANSTRSARRRLSYRRVRHRGRMCRLRLRRSAGALRLRLYDQVIQAAVGGQGVALGRIPMIAEHLRDGRLIAPFPKRYDSARGYFALLAPRAADRDEANAFLGWLTEEAARETTVVAAARKRRGSVRNHREAAR